MYKGRKIMAVIPARGGSKGLPGKNIRELSGKPLLSWSIEHALHSRYIDKVIVSTDSPKIAAVGRKHGAEVPFLRPGKLALSSSKTVDALLHALDYFRKCSIYFDLIVLLQPTSPLRLPVDIDNGIKLFFRKRANAIVSVCPAEHHPFWMNSIPKNGSLKKFSPFSAANINRQDLPLYYRINGALYIASVDFLIKNKSFLGKDAYAYFMPQERSVDIDTLTDFKLAEILLKKR